MDLPKMAMQTQREGPFPGIPVSRGQTHCSGLRFLEQTCVSRFWGPAQPPWPWAQRQEQVLPRRRGLQEGGAGKRRGKVGMRFPSGTEWGPPGNPKGPPRPRTQHHHQQLQTPALRGSQPEPGVVFKEMQFDLPSSFRNPARRTLPGPAGLVAAAGAAAGTFSPSAQTCADILTRYTLRG